MEQYEFENKSEEREDAEKLQTLIEKISQELEKEGLPITKECRIDIWQFQDVYPAGDKKGDVRGDANFVKKHEKELFYKDLSQAEIEEKKLMSHGEQFEKLKTAVLYKFFRKDFIVIRSSRFDDIENKVDNIIVERETGNMVCAFDAVADDRKARFSSKTAEIQERNAQCGGAQLKYGISIKDQKLVKKSFNGLPIFYLSLSSNVLKKGLKELMSSVEDKSKYEADLFFKFLAEMDSQIQELKLEPDLNKSFLDKLNQYQEALKKFLIKKLAKI